MHNALHKSLRVLLINVLGVLLCATAYGQVRINEVGYAGVDFEGSARWVELHNAGDAEMDVSSLWLCNFPNYVEISSLTVLQGSMTIPAGGYLVMAFDALGDGDGEVGLYDTNDFSNADAILDYVQYGSSGHMRASVAAEADLWDAGTFVPAAAEGQSLAFAGGGATSDQSWQSAPATPGSKNPANPATAEQAVIDRFSEDAGTLFVRDDSNGLPGPNEPIDFDQGEPFRTQGLGPEGETVQYYNFDVQPTTPAPIYVLVREGESAPVEDQLNIVDVVPGDEGYNDFWQVVFVTVPSDYVANTFTSADDLSGMPMETTDMLVNCPIVPEGSTAELRLGGGSSDLVQGWYEDMAIYYFDFSEASLQATSEGMVPTSPIYVSFNVNPGEDGGGPASGFMTEEGTIQTHNVVATLPDDAGYSPLWQVVVYDNAEFDGVSDLASASSATILVENAGNVNCPIAAVDPSTDVEPVDGDVPTRFALRGNYPNPFNPVTTIEYEVNDPGRVVLAVYDMLGRRVATLVDGRQTAGVYRARWDGRDAQGRSAASGVYLYQLTLDGEQTQPRRMVLVK